MAFGKHSGLSHIYSHDPASFRLASLLFLASSLKLEFLGEGSVLTSGAPRLGLPAPTLPWLRPSPSPFLIIPELPADSMLLFLVQVFHTHLLLSPRRVGRRRSFSWEPLSLGFFATVILLVFFLFPGPLLFSPAFTCWSCRKLGRVRISPSMFFFLGDLAHICSFMTHRVFISNIDFS